MKYEHIIHTIAPIYNENSRILILGTMPSPKSREVNFYYGHPQNRFWRVISAVRGEEVPQTVEQKTQFLLRNSIALWDTLSSCDITGAADSSIKNAQPNDLSGILGTADIHMIFTTGKTAYKYYCAYQRDKTGIDAVCLPSTSPANARMKLDELIEEYKIINRYI